MIPTLQSFRLAGVGDWRAVGCSKICGMAGAQFW